MASEMIVFCSANGVLISDTFGFAGCKELASFAKKLRLTRDHVRSEGHPSDEHYIVPRSKYDTMEARGAVVISELRELASYQNAKRERRVHKPAPPPPSTERVVVAKPEVSERFLAREAQRMRDRARVIR